MQKAHRWPQSAKLHPEQPERRAERHRSQYGPPSLYLSLVSPFTVIRAFQRFLFLQGWIVGDNLRLPIGWLHTKNSPGKRAFVAAVTQIQRLAFLSPQPCRGAHTMPHHQRKKRKEKEWHIEKGKTFRDLHCSTAHDWLKYWGLLLKEPLRDRQRKQCLCVCVLFCWLKKWKENDYG